MPQTRRNRRCSSSHPAKSCQTNLRLFSLFLSQKGTYMQALSWYIVYKLLNSMPHEDHWSGKKSLSPGREEAFPSSHVTPVFCHNTSPRNNVPLLKVASGRPGWNFTTLWRHTTKTSQMQIKSCKELFKLCKGKQWTDTVYTAPVCLFSYTYFERYVKTNRRPGKYVRCSFCKCYTLS